MPALGEDWRNGGFGLYVHWPFCSAKCPYCDFNSFVSDSIEEDRWVVAYVSEIKRVAERTSDRVLNSVFFGGGTPSLMSEGAIETILNAVRSHWALSNDIEITLEANPTSVEANRFSGYRLAGVNRISLGLQALNDPDLKRLGRLHSVSEGLKALEIAKSVFDRTSFDLIYSRQGQTLDAWKLELANALELADSHISMYQLTIEPNTAFGERYKAGKLTGLPSEDEEADMYALTQQMCASEGFQGYEVSNFARAGHECRHNLIYWKYGDYLGIGPGAHGRVTIAGQKFATETELSPAKWLKSVETLESGESKAIALAPNEMATEFLLMGLRLTEGVSLARLGALSTGSINAQKQDELIDLGMIRVENETLLVTERGRPLINAILRELLA